jgi:IS30 family transposase
MAQKRISLLRHARENRIQLYFFPYEGGAEKGCFAGPPPPGKEAEKRGKIPDITLADTRSAEINAREIPGHREGDPATGKDRKPAIPAAKRKTRFVQTGPLESTDARTVRKTAGRRFKKLEPAIRKSITFDRGKENSGHKQLSENTGTVVYFCHLRSPREKGTCENTSYPIRDMLYPVSDFREPGQRDVSKTAELPNGRPRKTLGFRTPYEVFSELR